MTKPRRLAWLRPPTAGPGGRMTLGDHLRELRYRFIIAALAVVVAMTLGFIFEPQLLRVILWPIQQAVATYQAGRPDGQVEMVTQGVTAGFSLYFRIGLVVGIIVACPVWLYQLWRFIVPALGPRERRAARWFLGTSIPLFLVGVALGYSICPRGFAVLLTFNPPSVVNLNDVGTFMDFELRLLLIFGLAFELPVLLVSLNRLGIVTGVMLGKARSVSVVLCGLFAAIATPTTDAITMLAVMIPMVVMYLVAEVLCRAHDRRRAALREGDTPGESFPRLAALRRRLTRSGG